MALRPIKSGSVLFVEQPVVAYQSRSPRGQEEARCPHCYRRECSGDASCLPNVDSAQPYLKALASSPFHRLEDLFSLKGQRFPILASKLKLRIHFDEVHGHDGGLHSSVQELLAPAMDTTPADMVASHDEASELLKHVLRSTLSPAAKKTPQLVKDRPRSSVDGVEWFVGVLGRLHLNAMRTPDGISALYAASSYFNHGCRENVSPRFDGGVVEWVAARDIAEDEECLISYHSGGAEGDKEDSQIGPDERSEAARDEFLHWNYGFRCKDTCSCGRFDN